MVLALAVLGAFALTAAAASADKGDPQPIDFTHNVVDAPAPVPAAVFGTAPPIKTGTAICTTPKQTGANANTDCETTSVGPHNETSIAVSLTDPDNMIGGVNDYQLALNPGGHVSETVLSRAHVTFDGGQTWSMYPVNSTSAYQATGGPSLAFDAAGHAYYGTLGFRFVGPVSATNPDTSSRTPATGARPGTWPASPRERGTPGAPVICSTRSTSPRGATATRSSRTATSGSGSAEASSRPGSSRR